MLSRYLVYPFLIKMTLPDQSSAPPVASLSAAMRAAVPLGRHLLPRLFIFFLIPFPATPDSVSFGLYNYRVAIGQHKIIAKMTPSTPVIKRKT